MMNELPFITAFLIGIGGSVHCIGMCGGIVAAFTFAIPKGALHLPYLLAYNLGRILSYVAAGALAGALGAALTHKAALGAAVLQLVSGFFLVLLGCYIGNWWRVLTHVEKAGQLLFRHISPLGKRFLPFSTPLYALPYGMIWGWLPCGLVYSTLTWSIASGSAQSGALVMLGFGLGTLPGMLAIGGLGESLKSWLNREIVRKILALSMFFFGLIFMVQAANNVTYAV